VLRIVDASGERRVQLTRRVTTVGSAKECHLRLQGEGVAAVHAMIYRDPAGFRVSVVEPQLVLEVEGRPTDRHLLRPGQELMLGSARLTLTEAEATGPEPPAPDPDTLLAQLQAFSRCVLDGEAWPRPAEVLLDGLLRASGAEHGFLLLVDQEQPRVVAARPALPPEEASRLLSDSIVQQALAGRRPVVLDDAARDPAFAGAPSVVRLQLSSVICLPLVDERGLLGALYLGHRARPGLFDAALCQVAQVWAAQASLLLRSARQLEALRNTVNDLRREVELVAERELVVQSPQMQRVLRVLERAAPTDVSVVLLGETGTGKELAGRLLHERSPRARGPFVALNCAAIPDSLLESELFGHARGAFTGAEQARVGLVEQAAGGTLLLDEIGEMPLALQAKLLRVLQERTVRRLGENSDRPVDVRVIAATNRELEGSEGFRQDLYYRVATLVVTLPPLRERVGDLELLSRLFLRRFSVEFQRGDLRLSQAASSVMRRHDWPGNVRELENRLRRAALLAEGVVLEPADLGLDPDSPGGGIEPLGPARDRFVAEHVRRALELCGGDRERAARELGVGLRSLYRYLKLDGGAP
jgi:transcriptional regulator with GAF, ATPase, and Fis domain